MKLKKGVTVYNGKEKVTDEIPDVKARKLGLIKPEKKEPDKK